LLAVKPTEEAQKPSEKPQEAPSVDQPKPSFNPLLGNKDTSSNPFLNPKPASVPFGGFSALKPDQQPSQQPQATAPQQDLQREKSDMSIEENQPKPSIFTAAPTTQPSGGLFMGSANPVSNNLFS
jgi:hypothetical protein